MAASLWRSDAVLRTWARWAQGDLSPGAALPGDGVFCVPRARARAAVRRRRGCEAPCAPLGVFEPPAAGTNADGCRRTGILPTAPEALPASSSIPIDSLIWHGRGPDPSSRHLRQSSTSGGSLEPQPGIQKAAHLAGSGVPQTSRHTGQASGQGLGSGAAQRCSGRPVYCESAAGLRHDLAGWCVIAEFSGTGMGGSSDRNGPAGAGRALP